MKTGPRSNTPVELNFRQWPPTCYNRVDFSALRRPAAPLHFQTRITHSRHRVNCFPLCFQLLKHDTELSSTRSSFRRTSCKTDGRLPFSQYAAHMKRTNFHTSAMKGVYPPATNLLGLVLDRACALYFALCSSLSFCPGRGTVVGQQCILTTLLLAHA